MAEVIRLAERTASRADRGRRGDAERPAAAKILILPCIRREKIAQSMEQEPVAVSGR